jgi:hypothetical protein
MIRWSPLHLKNEIKNLCEQHINFIFEFSTKKYQHLAWQFFSVCAVGFFLFIALNNEALLRSNLFKSYGSTFAVWPLVLLLIGSVSSIYDRKLLFKYRNQIFYMHTVLFIYLTNININQGKLLRSILDSTIIIIAFHLSILIVLYMIKKNFKIIFCILVGMTLFLATIFVVLKIDHDYAFAELLLKLRWAMPMVAYVFYKEKKFLNFTDLFNPANIFFSTGMPLCEFREIDIKSFATAIYDVVKILIHILILFLISIQVENLNLLTWIPAHILFYIIIYLKSYIGISTSISYLRFIGFKMNNAFRLPLMATNPTQRWRDWNTYYYEWFFKLVYYPAFKFSNSMVFSTLLVFFCTFIIHYQFNLIHLQNGISIILGTLDHFMFFMWNACFIIFYHLFPKIFGDEAKLSGWLGFAINFTCMCLMSFGIVL